MKCADFEILLCDYIDHTIDAETRAGIEEHQRTCEACAELFRDASASVAFLQTVDHPEPPPELLTRISFAIPAADLPHSGWRHAFFGWLQPILQPRFAMGMAMTILSFSMLGRFAGIEVRQLKPADLHPSAVWAALDNRIHRTWERAVKNYENLRLVYEVQTRLQEWTEQEEEEKKTRAPEGGGLPKSEVPIEAPNKERKASE